MLLLLGGQTTGHADGAGNAAGAGQRNATQSLRVQGCTQSRPRITDTRRTSITDVGNALTLLQTCGDGLRCLSLVMLVNCQQLVRWALQSIAAQHGLGMARVFTGNSIDQLQYVQRS